MFDNSLIILNQVLSMFILIAVGYVISKCGLITEQGAKQMTNVLLTVVTPALIINAFAIPFDGSKLAGMGIAFAVSAVCLILGVLTGKLFFRKTPKYKQAVFRFAIIYANTNFVAIPLIQAVLGDEAVIYGVMTIIAFQLFVWTQGVMLMANKSDISIRNAVINPGIIGIIIAAAIFFSGVSIPAPVHNGVRMLASLNTPLAMIIIGAFLANVKIKSALTQKGIYITTVIRLIVIPLAIIFLLHLFDLPEILFKACVISASAPIAANTSLFAARYEKDVELAGELVAFSTICSIATMPVMLMLVTALT